MRCQAPSRLNVAFAGTPPRSNAGAADAALVTASSARPDFNEPSVEDLRDAPAEAQRASDWQSEPLNTSAAVTDSSAEGLNDDAGARASVSSSALHLDTDQPTGPQMRPRHTPASKPSFSGRRSASSAQRRPSSGAPCPERTVGSRGRGQAGTSLWSPATRPVRARHASGSSMLMQGPGEVELRSKALKLTSGHEAAQHAGVQVRAARPLGGAAPRTSHAKRETSRDTSQRVLSDVELAMQRAQGAMRRSLRMGTAGRNAQKMSSDAGQITNAAKTSAPCSAASHISSNYSSSRCRARPATETDELEQRHSGEHEQPSHGRSAPSHGHRGLQRNTIPGVRHTTAGTGDRPAQPGRRGESRVQQATCRVSCARGDEQLLSCVRADAQPMGTTVGAAATPSSLLTFKARASRIEVLSDGVAFETAQVCRRTCMACIRSLIPTYVHLWHKLDCAPGIQNAGSPGSCARQGVTTTFAAWDPWPGCCR